MPEKRAFRSSGGICEPVSHPSYVLTKWGCKSEAVFEARARSASGFNNGACIKGAVTLITFVESVYHPSENEYISLLDEYIINAEHCISSNRRKIHSDE